ncbi:MAG: hypothetical protein ACRD0L_08590 [Acidimicrobiales bacterium]
MNEEATSPGGTRSRTGNSSSRLPPPNDYGDISTPTSWPRVPSADAVQEWNELRAWVETLCQRFSHLDHHVVPRCWWRHNGHVEALVALRDHERSSFSDTAPATAPLDWFRALRDVAALLRTWTAETSCGPTHQNPTIPIRPVEAGEWDQFVTGDVAARRGAEIETAAN